MTSTAVVGRFPVVTEQTGQGARLRARREALGLTGTALAKLAEVSREHLSAVESGHKTPTPEWVRRVELALDNYAHETGQDEPAPTAPAESAEPLRFTFRDIYGIGEIVAEGGDSEELLLAVRKLLADIRPTTPKD